MGLRPGNIVLTAGAADLYQKVENRIGQKGKMFRIGKPVKGPDSEQKIQVKVSEKKTFLFSRFYLGVDLFKELADHFPDFCHGLL